MSIYIPNAKMPESCDLCFARNMGYCNAVEEGYIEDVYDCMHERHKRCPLIEVREPFSVEIKNGTPRVNQWIYVDEEEDDGDKL